MNFADLVAKEREGLPKDELFGLAISGGGIRSATFALGVLQFLAWKNLLSRLHYLSTVSGGGYIGSWLSAWISRDGMKKVEADLVPPPLNPPKPIEAPQISWLRRYGKFLSPDLSFFSADTWLIIAIWSRNTLLNLILLVLFLASVLLGPWIFLGIYQSRYTGGYFSNHSK